MIMNKDIENIGPDKIYLRVGILKVLYLEKWFKEAADKESEGKNSKKGKQFFSRDKNESFQKNGFS